MKLVTTGLLTLMSLPLWASHPVLRTENCDVDIVVPKGSNAQFYLSKDCKTAFVLPAEAAPMKIDGLQLGAGVRKDTCKLALKDLGPKMEMIDKQIQFQQKKIEDFQEDMMVALQNATPEQRSEIVKSYETIFQRIESIIDGYKKDAEREKERLPFSKWEGANVNVHLSLNAGKEVNAFREANEGKGINFQMAPISSGILSFATNKEAASDIHYVSVLGAHIPGLSASGNDMFKDSSHVLANGGASGLVVLSQPAVCELVNNLTKEPEAFDKTVLNKDNILEAGFAANYIYDVRVTTNLKFAFEAASTPVDIMNKYQATIKKGEFTQEDISGLFTTGELKNKVKVSFVDGGIPFDLMNEQIEQDERLNGDTDSIFAHLYAHAMDTYLEIVMEKMQQLKMIQESVKNAPTPVSGKEAFNTRVVRKCRWKTRWGITRKKCSNHIEKDRYFIPGVATAEHVAHDSQTISLDFAVDAEQTLMMKHTAGFVLAKE